MTTATLIALAGLVLVLVYLVLPYLLFQWANVGVIRRGSGARPQIALTFDDGPDPATTPRVLDALEGAGATGTFFLLGEQALAHPDLARQIAARGHEIGAHGFRHRHAFLRAPWGLWIDMVRSAKAIEQATGVRPTLFRPAHGAYTLATPLACKLLRLTPVHWTIEARDWHPACGPDQVQARVLGALDPGDIVVLHDAGRGGSTTAAALPGLLQSLRERGYQCVSVGGLDRPRRGGWRETLLRVWERHEARFDRDYGVDTFPDHAQNVIRVARARYYGPPLVLANGKTVRPGDWAGEIHLNSARIQAVAHESALAVVRRLRFSIGFMAGVVLDDPKYQDIDLFFGTSLRPELYVPLGCHVAEFGYKRPWMTRYLRLLRAIYGAQKSRAPLTPQLVWIDRTTLQARYGREKTNV